MYQRILVATDGSESSQLALAHAIDLSRDQHAKLRIVHVVDPFILPMMGTSPQVADIGPTIETPRAAGREILGQASSAARSAGITADTALIEDANDNSRIASVIASEAERSKSDLIVMGTHGRRGLSHLFMGSVAESAIHIAPVPVLLVRARPTPK